MNDSATNGKMPLVLIIDDDSNLRDTLRLMLEDEAMLVVTASNGNEGLVAVEKHPVDLVITDILMPGKAGNEVIHDIRKARPGLPIIAMSGGGRTGNMDFLEIAKRQGVKTVLQKPFDLNAFILTVRKCIATGA